MVYEDQILDTFINDDEEGGGGVEEEGDEEEEVSDADI